MGLGARNDYVLISRIFLEKYGGINTRTVRELFENSCQRGHTRTIALKCETTQGG